MTKGGLSNLLPDTRYIISSYEWLAIMHWNEFFSVPLGCQLRFSSEVWNSFHFIVVPSMCLFGRSKCHSSSVRQAFVGFSGPSTRNLHVNEVPCSLCQAYKQAVIHSQKTLPPDSKIWKVFGLSVSPHWRMFIQAASALKYSWKLAKLKCLTMLKGMIKRNIVQY